MCRARALRALSLVCGLAAAAPARPASITVDSPADESSTSTANGTCTLREAVIAANLDAQVDGCAAGSGADVIVLPAGTYALTLAGADENDAQTGDLDLGFVTLQGAGAATTVIRGGGDRVLQVPGWATVTISGVTVEQGAASYGGGIYVDGMLVLSDSVVRANLAGAGGGIFNSAGGTVQIVRSTLADNVADGPGGGGAFNLGQMTLTNATVSGNQATSPMANGGGGIENGLTGTLGLASVTFASNLTPYGLGHGILSSGTVTLTNTLLAHSGASCAGAGTFATGGHNLESGDSCQLTGTGDLPSTDPSLGTLLDNGGGTPTHALPSASPAVDAGSSACPGEDQRGASRPQDGDADGIPLCDIGAFELETQVPVADLAVTIVPSVNPVRGGEPFGWFVTVVNAGPSPAASVVATAVLPGGTTLTSTWASQGSCAGSGPVTCDLGTVGSGGSAGITLSVKAPAAPGVIEASASVTSATLDPDAADDGASASVTVEPPYPPVTISPAATSVPPGGEVRFAAGGGTGTGWTWGITTNGSGAWIDPAAGVYTAGATAGVVDEVWVNDSLGHLASASVTVTAPPDEGGGCGCGRGGGAAASSLFGLLVLLRRRGARYPRTPPPPPMS
jgi:CSLREA domain-containing protein/uncharacterized repeat protein (TIGR01451 family)